MKKFLLFVLVVSIVVLITPANKMWDDWIETGNSYLYQILKK